MKTIHIIILFTLLSCVGAVGPQGLKSLIKITEEPSGINCAEGGQRIDTGIDSNNDDILQDEEIQSTAFICNGTNGRSDIIAAELEPAGTNCSYGGIKIESGTDLNGNNILDSEEIEVTQYVCNGEDVELETFIVENNDQVTKDDNSWSDYLTTEIEVQENGSSVLFILDISATGVSSSPEIAFRSKLDSDFSNPTLIKWITFNALEKGTFTFLMQNVNSGTYTAGVQWNAITGGITTSAHQQDNAFNRLIIVVLP